MKTKTLFIVFSCFFLQSPLFSQEKIEDYTNRYDNLITIKFLEKNGKNKKVRISRKHLIIVLNNWEDALKVSESSDKYGHEKIEFESEGNKVQMDAWRFRWLVNVCKNVKERKNIESQINDNKTYTNDFIATQKEKRKQRRKESEKSLKEKEEKLDKQWGNLT